MGRGSRPRLHGWQALRGNNGERDGFPSPLSRWQDLDAGITEGGMGPRIREDNEEKGNCRNGGMSGKGEEGGRARMRDSSAALGMICGRWGKRTGMGSRPRFHGWQVLRGNNGGRDGFPSPFSRVAGASREQRREGWVPVPPSSRGQDLDARTTRGRAARFLGSVALRSE